ncbi:ATP synthase epsilon chain [Cutibacterium acnes JCM 18916]|nr:ATP synthase epsilon chain [Cutibacterium acnes JCM 18916]
MDHPPLQVKVVSADREVWKGESVNIIVRTTEGDIGLLPGHEPFLRPSRRARPRSSLRTVTVRSSLATVASCSG